MDRKEPVDDAASIASSFVSVSPTASVNSAAMDDEPPPYSAVVSEPPLQWTHNDPRSSSTQSLVAQESDRDDRRKLLLIYIHGFMGNETSFQGFPAHVHNLVTVLLHDSHVVHTKIYPRYMTRRALNVATNDFSKWLAPREASDTDIVLLGHSMGGLLSAEVALLPPDDHGPRALRHNIIGTVNFDVPFLGMHPGVVKSGLGSLFRPYNAPPSPQQQPTSPVPDPTYNPPFPNDINLPVRKGWNNALHFVNKHSKNLTSATRQLITSHIEFGSCLADFDNLKIRYVRLRMLEEEDGTKRASVRDGKSVPRVRFVNYYTASTGRPKKGKSPAQDSSLSLVSPVTQDPQKSGSDANNLASDRVAQYFPTQSSPSSPPPLQVLDPLPDVGSDLSSDSDLDDISSVSSLSSDEASSSKAINPSALSPMPSAPQPPERPGPGPLLINYRNDVPAFKMALVQYRDDTKAYAQALKEYHKQLNVYRKEEAKRRAMERRATMEANAEEMKLEAELRKEENRRIVEAIGPEEKRQAIEAMRERRTREFDLRREQLKQKVKEEKEHRKAVSDIAKSQKKFEKKKQKLERKSEKDALKHHEKMRKAELKIQRKLNKSNKCGPSPSSSTDPPNTLNEVLFDAVDAGESSSRSVLSRSTTESWPEEKTPAASTTSKDSEKEAKAKKDRKFCLLPPKDSNGIRDHCWHRVFMQDVDEVGAHCGLFFPQGITSAEATISGQPWSDRYAGLVSDVAERIETWLHDEMTERMMRGVQAL